MSAHKKKTIVAVGLYRPGTGFTRVFSSLFSALKKDYDIHWLGISHRGEILDYGYKVYPSNLQGGDMYGAFESYKMAEEFQADIVLLLNDFWMFKNYNVTHGRNPGPWKVCAYIPLDGCITEYESMGNLSVLDHIVVYTEFAKNEVLNAFSQVSRKPDVSVIAHGTDTSDFKPLDIESQVEVLELKKKVFVNLRIDQTSFILLNANRYSERKDLECTLHGFAHFAKDKPDDVYLCLHQPGIADFQKENLLKLIKGLNIEDRVVINPYGDGNYVNDNQLNDLYNACDVGINTSLGEGWGMISFEHGACKKPQVVPAHSACKELWDGYGLLLDPVESLFLSNNPFLMYRSSPIQLAQHLNQLYTDKTLYDDLAEKAFKNAKRTKYSWTSVAHEWDSFFTRIL